MRYPPSLLEEIRTRLPTSLIVGRRVKLKKAGAAFKGLCPFHQEKTGSFQVDDRRGRWHCFGCGKDGDVFGFLCEAQGLTFPEAVEALAREAGVELPKASAESVKREAQRLSLMEIMSVAADFYRAQLAGPAGEAARAYLDRRKISRRTIERFGIGFAPDSRSALKQHLAGKGVSQDDMAAAGLIVTGDDIPVPYDRFRGRVMIPIADDKGRTIAFGGRILGDGQPKYLNSPATPLFDKGRTLFNHGPARDAAWQGGTVVAVEGYTATMRVVEAGFEACVAPMGTALTEDQARLLWRMSETPIFCYDGDAAGQAAAAKTARLLLPLLVAGRSAAFATMPLGVDPDDLIRDRGPAAFQAAIAKASPLVDVVWRSETAGKSFATPDNIAALRTSLAELTAAIPDQEVRRAWREDFEDRVKSLKVRPRVFRSNGHSHHSTSPSSIRLSQGFDRSSLSLRDAIIVAAMVGAPDVVATAMENIVETRGLSPETLSLIGRIGDQITSIEDTSRESVLDALGRAGLGLAVREAIDVCDAAGLGTLSSDVDEATRVLMERRRQ